MLRTLGVLAIIGFTIYGIIDCASSPKQYIRLMPKYLWLLLIVLLPIIGVVLWLFFGRPLQKRTSPRVIAPEDDPDFLRQLEIQKRQAERRRQQSEQGNDSSDSTQKKPPSEDPEGSA